ncbi:MAG: hypothetical protein E6K93_06355 [Thaumarchaeota archaeon]|nr:MAG: hypothetical protein E6K93_06355 [Nitrososphaerota archaeon]
MSEPKALLFDKEKNVLSIPIFQQYYGGPVPLEGGIGESNSGSTTSGGGAGKPIGIVPPRYMPPNNWKGFYVFGVDPVKGFTLRGIVEHYNGTSYDYSFGSRSFYIDDSLYTVTSGLMKINDLGNIKNEISQIKLEDTGAIIKYLN